MSIDLDTSNFKLWETSTLRNVVANKISLEYAISLQRDELIEVVINIIKLEQSGQGKKTYAHA